jgi:guanylate kinase
VHPRAIVVSGPSGVGKSSIIKAVLSNVPQARMAVSTTTRSPRPGEQDGVDYYFVTHEEFQDLVRRNMFLEWAEVYGQLYGTRRDHLQQLLDDQNVVLLDVDSQGARQMQDSCDGLVYILIAPPSMAELKRRLVNRRTETPENLARRLAGAHREMRRSRLYDHIVVNRELEDAIEETLALVREACTHNVPVVFTDDLLIQSVYQMDVPTEEEVAIAGKRIQHTVQASVENEVLSLVQERVAHVMHHELEGIVRDVWNQVRPSLSAS